MNVEITYKTGELQVSSDNTGFKQSYPSIVLFSINKNDGKRLIEAVGMEVPASVIDEARRSNPQKDYHFIDPFAINSFDPDIS